MIVGASFCLDIPFCFSCLLPVSKGDSLLLLFYLFLSPASFTIPVMPFINPWSHRPSSPSLKKPDNDKYQVVEDILSAPDYYHVLGVSKDASTEDIRRAYIKVLPSKAKAKEGSKTDIYNSFRKVESATLTNSSRLILEQPKAFNVS